MYSVIAKGIRTIYLKCKIYLAWEVTRTSLNHHHDIVLAARISLTLSRHSSLSFIALGRSSGQQPVSSHSCWMYVRAGRPAFARPCVGRVFANGPGDLGSIPGRVIPKTLKMELDTTLLNTQHYKVRFKGKVEQSWEWSSALPYTLV